MNGTEIRMNYCREPKYFTIAICKIKVKFFIRFFKQEANSLVNKYMLQLGLMPIAHNNS